MLRCRLIRIAFLTSVVAVFSLPDLAQAPNTSPPIPGQVPAPAAVEAAAPITRVQSPIPAGAPVVGPNRLEGVRRGAHAMHGFTERFNATMRCVAGTATAEGFEVTKGSPCVNPGSFHSATGTFDLERTLAFGATSAPPPSSTHFALQFSASNGPASNTYVGMSTCAVGTFTCGAASEIGVLVNASAFSLQVGGATLASWSIRGNPPGSGLVGTTDSGNGNVGFGPPNANASYGVTLTVPGDGTAILSVLPMGGALCLQACGYVARVPITMPTGGLHQFFVRGGAGDAISDVSYAGGYTLDQGNASAVYDIAGGPQSHVGEMLRWALHADGTEWDYKTPATDIANVFAVIPPNYNPEAANPLALQVRGQESSVISFFGTFHNVTEALYQNGFVQGYLDFHHGTIYGSPADLTDVAGAMSVLQGSLALVGRPFLMADSGGGIVALDAIAHGAIAPLALLCYSCNTNLFWDAYTNKQMPFVETDYGFADPAQYSAYTGPSGEVSYDPTVAIRTLGSGQTLLTGVPMLFIADQAPGDATVATDQNSALFTAAANRTRAGTATIVYVGGGHVSPNKFNGPQALSFFNQH